MKRRISPADRLIRIVVRRRGAATSREIARTHLTGTDFEEAKRETTGLVVFEPTYQNGRRKRSQTARLTQKGVWQAIRLTRGYDPTLVASVLAATDIKTILDRLEAERNPLALELAGYRHDAQAYRVQEKRREAREREAWKTIEKVREILARPRHKLSARHYEKLNQFLESRGINRTVKVSAFGQPAFALTPGASQIPSGARVATPPINPRPIFKPPMPPALQTPVAPLSDYAKYIRDNFRGMGPQPSTPTTTTTGESRTDIIRRANIAGFPTRGGREVQLNSEWVSCEQWAAANPK